MDNPFAQFGTLDNPGPALAPPPVAPATAAPAGDNPFDKIGTLDGAPANGTAAAANDGSLATLGSTAKQVGVGMLQSVPNMVEGAADVGDTAAHTDLQFRNPATGESMFSQLGRDLGLTSAPAPAPNPYQPQAGAAIKSGLDKAGLNPDNLPQPQNAPERVANTAGQVAGSILAPQLAVGRLGILGQTAKAALEPIIGSGTTGSMAANAAKGLLAGTGSGVAQEAVPDQYKPIAGVVGGLAGGLAAEAPGILANTVKKAASTIPITRSQVETAAGKKLYNAAENPQTTMQTIADNPNPELVPGSAPTTGQMTGDRGILSLEGAVSRQSPEEFVARREAQNNARNDALAALQPDGDPAAVGSFFRSQLADLDASSQSAIDAATANAQKATGSIGGTQLPEVTGGQMRGILDSSTPRMPGIGGQQTAEVMGGQMRGALENSIADMRTRERTLWAAVPKDVSVVSDPLKQTAAGVYGTLTPEVKSTLTPIERDVQGFINSYNQQIPFERLNGLRQIVNQGIREARSPLQPNEAAYGRLSQVRGSIDDAIEASLSARAAHDQQAVASGAMAPEDSIAANVQKWRDGWYADQQARAANSADLGRNAVGGQGPIPSSRGASSQGRGQAGYPSSDTGLQGNVPERPLIDEAGAGILKQANAATKQRKDLTGAQPVAGILQRPYATSPYKVGDAAVPGRIWRSGPEGSDSVGRYLAAAQSSPEAVAAIKEAAAQSLRTEAAVNGFLSQKAFDTWKGKYAAPLQKLEQAAPGTLQTFAKGASNAGEDVRGILTRPDVVNAAIPSMIWKTGPKGAQSVHDFVTSAARDPKAVAALKEAASNSLMSKVKNGVLSESDFQAWRNQHGPALQELEKVAHGTLAEFENAAAASKTIETAAQARKTQLDQFNKSALGDVLNLHDPADVTKRIGTTLKGQQAVGKMRQIAEAARKDPAAFEGLRKSVADYISQELVGNTEVGTSGRAGLKADAFQTFVRKNDAALREVMTPEEVNTLHAVAADLQRSARSANAVKIPGGSDTKQNINAAAKHGEGGGSMLATMLGGGLGLMSGHGAIGTGIGAVVGAIRKAGYGRVDDLVRDALLNPELARTLMMKVPTSKGATISLANRLLRAAAAGGSSEEEKAKH